MLDLKWVREHPEEVKRAAARKRIAVDVDAFLELERRQREALTRAEELRAALRAGAERLGQLPAELRAEALARQQQLKAEVKELEPQVAALTAELRALSLRLPMPPAPEVPDGRDDRDNVELKRVGEPPRLAFPARSHVELGEKLGIVDIARGVKLAGSRNYLLLGDGALLEQAVLQLALSHMRARGFELCSVPTLVNRAWMEGTGYFPGGEEQAYACERDDQYLVGTSEVSLTSIHAGEVLDARDLPVRRIGLTPCYRREAGTYGKDTKGLYRVHQFWKVEQVVVGPADEAWSREEHLRMLGHATDFLDLLELPYRVVNVCSGDLGQGQVQKFDVETWMPSRGGYGETHSASRFHDFQARRLELRYKPRDGGKPRYCHTLNNTVIASPRVLIAILENFQQADGSVRVPPPLRAALGKDVLAPPGGAG
ncbi:MAG: serine--tRNA ligase [Planctomycetota bacterium]|nr:MAG: serine--tRNA ligase [Planctomycetota bacterium]